MPPAAALERAPATPENAERALERLGEMVSLLGSALIGPGGRPLAASGALERWGGAAERLLAAADDAGDAAADHVHVATEEGEVFALRADDLALVAVTPRFPLASLTFSDMRAVLRDLQPRENEPRG